MELARRLFIYGKKNCNPPANYDKDNANQCVYDPTGKYGAPVLGGINNGYTEEELIEFWEKLKGYASYLFNKSHSACYAVLTLCTMFLKKKDTANFIAALLSMQDKEEKIDLYSKMAANYNIKIKCPNVNYSNYDFTAKDNEILYGLKNVKGLGENSIDNIIKSRPFTNIQDTLDKMEKKHANKRVMFGLIKSGAFDFYNANRYESLNELMDIRKDKDDRYVPMIYDKSACMSFEKETLGTSLTFKPWWDTIQEKEMFVQDFKLKAINERPDKNGNLMGFATLSYEDTDISALIFSSLYKKTKRSWKTSNTNMFKIKGTRSSKNILIKELIEVNEIESENMYDIFDDSIA